MKNEDLAKESVVTEFDELTNEQLEAVLGRGYPDLEKISGQLPGCAGGGDQFTQMVSRIGQSVNNNETD